MKDIIEFINKKFPVTKNRMEEDLLNNISGTELVELIDEYNKTTVLGIISPGDESQKLGEINYKFDKKGNLIE